MPLLPFASKSATTKEDENNKKSQQPSKSRRRSSKGSSAGAALTSHSDHIAMEQSRRASLASSIADSVDYQAQQDAVPASPRPERRSSGPTSTRNILDIPTTYPRALLEREDSWGNLSLENL